MIRLRTLLNRAVWANLVSNVIGAWGVYRFDYIFYNTLGGFIGGIIVFDLIV